MLIRPKIFDPSLIIAAQSTRIGGVSPAPFNSLNLGLSVNDEEQNVLKNRELFFKELGIDQSKTVKSHQVHGTEILVTGQPIVTTGYDGLITNTKETFLVISIADCTPILIHDEKNNVIAALHAGWKGTMGKIVSKAMGLMKKEFGSNGNDCRAFIGACITQKNFELGEEVAKHFDNTHKYFDKEKQKWFVDLKLENADQLMAAGVPLDQIEISEYCTYGNNDLFFSHRKEKGKTGRMMAVIGLRE